MQSYYACIRPYLELALRQQPFKWLIAKINILIQTL